MSANREHSVPVPLLRLAVLAAALVVTAVAARVLTAWDEATPEPPASSPHERAALVSPAGYEAAADLADARESHARTVRASRARRAVSTRARAEAREAARVAAAREARRHAREAREAREARRTAVPPGTVWDALAACESTGRWHYNGSSGFDGGLQFQPSTWVAFGGTAYAPAAWQATRGEQITVARRVQAAQGWRAWPVCSRKVGLR